MFWEHSENQFRRPKKADKIFKIRPPWENPRFSPDLKYNFLAVFLRPEIIFQ